MPLAFSGYSLATLWNDALSARPGLPGRSTCSRRVVSVVRKRVSLAIAMLIGPVQALSGPGGLIGKVDVEVINRRALELALLRGGSCELEQPGKRILKGFGVFEADGDEHPLAVFLDRLLEVADDRDPVAQGAEDVVLEAERLAAVGADELLFDQVDHAGLELVGELVSAVKALSRSKLMVW